MTVFRIEREKYLKQTLKGIGAALSTGFRWNSQNTRLVYTSESRALATLEIMMHLDLAEDLPVDRHFVEIFIPDDVLILEVALADLPKNWDAKPPISITQAIGDEFVLGNQAAVLKVPSSIISKEFNYLINPIHGDAQKIKVTHSEKLKFDKRMGIKK